MAAPYSLDLRRKMVKAYERGVGSQRQLDELFGVSLSFMEKLLMPWRGTGQLAPKPHAGGKPSRLDAKACQHLRDWRRAQSDRMLAELAERPEQMLGLRMALSRLSRVLQEMNLPRKKSLYAKERDRAAVTLARAAYQAEVASLPLERFRFVGSVPPRALRAETQDLLTGRQSPHPRRPR